MADSLGDLLIRLLWDDSGFTAGSKASEAKFREVSASMGAGAVAVGNLISGAFTTALGAIDRVVTSTVQTGAAFERQIDIVGALAGANAQQLAQLEERARQLGRDTVFSATQAADAMTVLAQAGKTVEESIRLSGVALNFAQAQGVGLEQATELLVATTNQYKLQNLDAAKASDILTFAANRSQLNFERLRNALRFAGPQAAAFGISLEETSAALAAFADLGFRGTQAGTTFRTALAEVAAPSKRATEMLAALGIQVEELNPSVVGFNGLIERLAASQFDAAAAVRVFGVEVGPTIAALVQATRSGVIDLQAFTDEMKNASGATAAQVELTTQNLATQFKLLQSSIEDLGLSVFDGISVPLQRAIEGIRPVIDQTSAAIGDASQEIRVGLSLAVQALTAALAKNGREIATTIAGAVRTLATVTAAVVVQVANLVSLFGELERIAEASGLATFADEAAVVVGEIAALGSAVVGLSSILGGAGGVTAGFGAIVGALGGPIGAVTVAIAGLVAGLILYEESAQKAARATEALQNVAARRIAQDANLLGQLSGGLDIEQVRKATDAFVANARLAEAGGKKLGKATLESVAALEALQNATDEEIAIKVTSGELVVAGGRLATVASLVENLDETGFDAINDSAATFREEARRINAELPRMREELSAANRVNVAAGKELAGYALGTKEATEEFIKTQEETASRLIGAARKIERERDLSNARIVAGAVETEQAITAETSAQAEARAKAAQAAEDARIAQAKRAAEEIQRLSREAERDALQVVGTEADRLGAQLDAQIAEVSAALATYLDTTADTEAERVRLIETADATVSRLQATAIARLTKVGADAATAQEAAAQAGVDAVSRVYRRSETTQERIAREVAEAVRRVEASADAERLALAEQHAAERARAEIEGGDVLALAARQAEQVVALDTRIAAQRAEVARAGAVLRVRAEQEAQAAAIDLAQRLGAVARTAEQAAQSMADEMFRAPGPFESAFTQAFARIRLAAATEFPAATQAVLTLGKGAQEVARIVGGLGSLLSGALDALTGGALDLSLGGIVADVVSGQTDAADAVTEAQTALRDARRAAAQGAGDAAEVAAAQADLRDALRAQRDTAGGGQVVREAVDAAVAFAVALAEQVPEILDTVIAELPRVVDTLLGQVGPLIAGVLDALPGLIDVVVAQLVRLIDRIPAILGTILDRIPAILTALLGAVPLLLRAVVGAVPRIVAVLVAAVPEIVRALLSEVPRLVGAVVGAVPKILTGVVVQLPQLIAAIVGLIPDVIVAVVRSVPQIFKALILNLPSLILAIIAAIPQIAVALIAQIPRIAVVTIRELVRYFVKEVPSMALAFVRGLPRAIEQTAAQIGRSFASVFKFALGGSGGKDGAKNGGGLLGWLGLKDKGSAQGGLDFVPATGSYLLHQGEKVLTAEDARSARRRSSRTRNPMQPAASVPLVAAAGAGAASGLRVEIPVVFGDRVLDRVLVDADERGGLSAYAAGQRRRGGVRPGHTRRR